MSKVKVKCDVFCHHIEYCLFSWADLASFSLWRRWLTITKIQKFVTLAPPQTTVSFQILIWSSFIMIISSHSTPCVWNGVVKYISLSFLLVLSFSSSSPSSTFQCQRPVLFPGCRGCYQTMVLLLAFATCGSEMFRYFGETYRFHLQCEWTWVNAEVKWSKHFCRLYWTIWGGLASHSWRGGGFPLYFFIRPNAVRSSETSQHLSVTRRRNPKGDLIQLWLS